MRGRVLRESARRIDLRQPSLVRPLRSARCAGQVSARLSEPDRLADLPPGLAARIVGFCEELRGEAINVGTYCSGAADAYSATNPYPGATRH